MGAYVAETPELPFSIGVIYRELTRGDPRTRLLATVNARAKSDRPLSASCTSALGDFCSASEKTFASIKQTITARMNLWLNPRICAATDASDFDLRQLRSKRMSVCGRPFGCKKFFRELGAQVQVLPCVRPV